MKRVPPMTTVAERADDVVSIVVTHDPAQSYSRAVTPRAMKAAKELGLPQLLTLEVVDIDAEKDGLLYGSWNVAPGRTATVFYFSVDAR